MEVLIVAPLYKEEIDKIRKEFPEDKFIYCQADEITQEMVDTCDVIIGNPADHVELNRANLKALLLHYAGSDNYVEKDILHEHTVLTNASGSYGKTIAEHTIGMMLTLNKNFKTYMKQMDTHVWQKKLGGKELLHSTVLIVGLGDIGYALAKRLKAFECTIIGIKKTPSNVPDAVDEVYTIDQLDNVLPLADYVVLALPQNKETRHMFHKVRLMKMKHDAVLVNVGRGSAINTKDLIEVMKEGHLYGAALDVVEEEPLKEMEPLWDLENVFITPHASGGFEWDSVHAYYVDLIIRNLYHLKKNERLENEVNRETGYRDSRSYTRNEIK